MTLHEAIEYLHFEGFSPKAILIELRKASRVGNTDVRTLTEERIAEIILDMEGLSGD